MLDNAKLTTLKYIWIENTAESFVYQEINICRTAFLSSARFCTLITVIRLKDFKVQFLIIG